ncbi:hypothetical protein [Burkholderia multivorans]|uniref:hypothetical protein n=1 Tax=Burkholderia multivorans TaxID=87883 RepID=UPI000CFE87CB|nr:hypothetical protein [Burkholderia multivorans]PRF91638.1 hypothetical protein C6Q23_09900 [Burkholderia multivorans]
MTEPILSREEVVELLYACNLPAECEPAVVDFAERYEAALLQKLRGAPVAFVCSASNDFSPIIRDKAFAQKLSDEHGDGKIVPLYTLKGQS